ncbi:hypothetical protein TRV_03524 [Trichophyton verrucosum HKI 0517]|uniref:Uncharacterized protein n=1 Tax=Trichophyton verrucosum (strain HKI 0517) TaxID=663202 RepID=D4D8T6_TRIVH|nr:uncharacterized protein TRV_03524 [Trichophyton verrucosum HKI 0517]EFE41695.1 hypothetical protein TRV_03524 [Trichophyton verrucosum HKI 0517]
MTSSLSVKASSPITTAEIQGKETPTCFDKLVAAIKKKIPEEITDVYIEVWPKE